MEEDFKPVTPTYGLVNGIAGYLYSLILI